MELDVLAIEPRLRPDSTLFARYEIQSDDASGILDVAMDTSIPSINLDAVPGITKIRCTDSFVRISFVDTSSIKDWEVGKDGLILHVGPKWKCDHSGDVVYKRAKALLVVDQTAYFYAKEMDLSRYTKEVKVSVGMKEYKKGFEFAWEKANQVIEDNRHFSAYCKDCKLNGDISFSVNISQFSGPLTLPKIVPSIGGIFNSKMDLKIAKKAAAPSELVSYELYRRSFPTIVIPKIAVISEFSFLAQIEWLID